MRVLFISHDFSIRQRVSFPFRMNGTRHIGWVDGWMDRCWYLCVRRYCIFPYNNTDKPSFPRACRTCRLYGFAQSGPQSETVFQYSLTLSFARSLIGCGRGNIIIRIVPTRINTLWKSQGMTKCGNKFWGNGLSTRSEMLLLIHIGSRDN